MTEPGSESSGLDLESARTKYRVERNKRLVEGRGAIRDLSRDAVFARYREDPFTPFKARPSVADEVDVAIVGAGMAAIVVGAHLRRAGVGQIRLIDQAGGVGGTWYWNRYPGVMCDVESYCYMPMLEEMGYLPTTRYAFGGEIREHLEAIAARHDLIGSALFHTAVERSEWDEERARWIIRTDRGDEILTRYLILAVGILNLMKLPAIPGMEQFAGRSFHTARWDYEYTGGSPTTRLEKLTDKVVAILGTGASAVQCIPPLAESAKQLLVFQRTPAAVGVRGNQPTSVDFAEDLQPGWQRRRMENFQAVMLGRPVEVDLVDDGWCHHFAPTIHPERTAGLSDQEFVRRAEQFDFDVMEAHRKRITNTVADPMTAAALMPYYRYVCRRPLFHDEFLPAFNSPNVTVVECSTGIERVTDRGVIVGGREYNCDCIIYATGFEAEATPLPRRVGHEVVGRGHRTLEEKWQEGPSTLFGMMTRGFPNMFIMPAPGQQAVVTVNYTLLALVAAEHISATIADLDARAVGTFEVTEEAEDEWCQTILASYVANNSMAEACPPSFRLETPAAMNPRNGSFGGGFGDYFGFCDRLAQWRQRGDLGGLELLPLTHLGPSRPRSPQAGSRSSGAG
jgi:cation diffusion facilitator CzcD-associated flavoprotein CzcO